MSHELWTAVDTYIHGVLVGDDPVLREALRESDAAGLPAIQVTPTQGKLLNLLARFGSCKSILEIGTLGGYSTIWLARALPPDGRLITLEVEESYATVARANLERAGLSGIAEVRIGRALETLPVLAAENAGPFDLVFIDADKPSNPEYFTWALELSRPGSLIVIDNVIRDGAVIEPDNDDPGVQGVRLLNDLLAAEPRVSATVIQTVGAKGYDGFAVALVTSTSSSDAAVVPTI